MELQFDKFHVTQEVRCVHSEIHTIGPALIMTKHHLNSFRCKITGSGIWTCKAELPGFGVVKENALSIIGKCVRCCCQVNAGLLQSHWGGSEMLWTQEVLFRVTTGIVQITVISGFFKCTELNSETWQEETQICHFHIGVSLLIAVSFNVLFSRWTVNTCLFSFSL